MSDLSNARAFAAGQAAWDNAAPPDDPPEYEPGEREITDAMIVCHAMDHYKGNSQHVAVSAVVSACELIRRCGLKSEGITALYNAVEQIKDESAYPMTEES